MKIGCVTSSPVSLLIIHSLCLFAKARVEKVLGYELDTRNGSIPFDIEIAEAIHYVWNDPVVSKILDERSSNFYLIDSAP